MIHREDEYLQASCRIDARRENATFPFRHGRRWGLGLGVLIAVVSSALGGTAAAVTRYLVGDADALTLAILRWGIGCVCVLPVALLLRAQWPARRDWPAAAGVGVCGCGLSFLFYTVAFA